MSFKPEVRVYGETRWSGNSLVFATKEESDAYVHDLFMRWTQVEQTRSVESDEPVTHAWIEGSLMSVGAKNVLLPPGCPDDPE